ncbi:MAG: hypothetical protein HFJ32_00895 [Clostridia bacterium]|nr:hypothetical protein [Clostridia bacterium]
MKSIVMQILKGEMTANQAKEQYQIDRETIRRKINEFVQEDSNFLREYVDYQNRKGYDYGKINFKGLIIYIIRNDLSQSEAARDLDIPSRTISRELEKLGESEDPKDIKLYEIAKICAERKMKRIPLNEFEKALYTSLLEEMFGDIPVIDIDMKSKTEQEIERLEAFMQAVQYLQGQGKTAEQVAAEMQTSISTVRRNRLKLEELKNTSQMRKQIEKE